MTVTRDQIQMLTTLAIAARPYGARRWDQRGTYLAIEARKHFALAEVALDVLACAMDPEALTPGVIGKLDWRNRLLRIDDTAPARPTVCPAHSLQFRGGICPSCRADEIAGDGPAPRARPDRGLPPDQIHDVVTELKDIATTATSRETR